MNKTCLLAISFAAIVAGCDKKTDAPTKTAAAGDPNRGRAVYLANCAACHNPDPSKDGSLGPAIKGASRELIEARVLRGTYPPGYTPKRKTTAMPAQPYLEKSIPDLVAFLADS
jgi:mono/diheme cytochrome c family protein